MLPSNGNMTRQFASHRKLSKNGEEDHVKRGCVLCNGWVQVVSSAASDAASRMALFGSINSASALVIALLQLAATGRLLKHLGLAIALTLSPTFAAALMLGIAVSPTPLVVASGEVLRKASHLQSQILLRPVILAHNMHVLTCI